MYDGSASTWRESIDRHHAALLEEVTAAVQTEVAEKVADAVARATTNAARKTAESVNQTLRRMRTASAEHEVLQLLIDDTAPFAERTVVVLIENNQARTAAWRGVVMREEAEDVAPIDLNEAAAMSSCVETRDPLVALATPGEISPILATALSRGASDKVYLFPVLVRQNTVALMLACGEVIPASIEVLCEAAGMKLELIDAPLPVAPAPPPPPALVNIAGIEPAAAKTEPATTWARLTPEDQALHVKAQRTARVRVAQIRISEPDALRKGIQQGDVYSALRESIDAAREEFQRSFTSRSSTMVDYLHLEVLRSLAHDNSRLLGPTYPGPVA